MLPRVRRILRERPSVDVNALVGQRDAQRRQRPDGMGLDENRNPDGLVDEDTVLGLRGTVKRMRDGSWS